MHLERILAKEQFESDVQFAAQRDSAHDLFSAYREFYLNQLLKYIRAYTCPPPAPWLKPTKLPDPWRDMTWCSAAALLLTSGMSEKLQGDFLLAPQVRKDQIINAIIADGGLEDAFGQFLEIPQC